MFGNMSSTTPRLSPLPEFPGRKLVYHHLNSAADEIRVIVVVPDTRREAPLRCFLKTISIYEGKSTEPYNAISYYWGSTKRTETVEIYGESREYDRLGGSFKIPITSNLALALRQFRADATAECRRLVIWTDALCINQTDLEERSAQVSIMRDIYKAALSVWMWIGGTSLAAETGLHNLYSHANHTHPSKVFTKLCSNSRLYEMVTLQANAALGDSHAHLDLYRRNIVEFINAPYWQRGWIIQEATANTHTYICYGPARYRIISWISLLRLAVDLLYITIHFDETIEEPVANFVYQMMRLTSCEDAWKTFGMLSIESVRLQRTGKSECETTRLWLHSVFNDRCWHTSDPRDRVNAIMCAMPPYYSLEFRPDYSKSTEDVFASATVHFLHTGRSWSHLQFLAPSGSPYLPSWSIDFTEAGPLFPSSGALHHASSQLYFTGFFIFVQKLNRGSLPRFAADAKTPFRLRRMTRGVLETDGFVVDQVVSVGPLFTATLDCKDDTKDVLRACYRLLSRSRRYTRRNTTLRGRARKWETFCWTLCIGMAGGLELDASHASASETLWDVIIHDRRRHPEDMHPEAEKLYKEMRSALTGTRFIVTRKGRIGVAPRNVAVGDSIGVLASGDVPFVLRSAKTEDVPGVAYILIGGCYIDGKSGESHSCKSTADRDRDHVRRSCRRGSRAEIW